MPTLNDTKLDSFFGLFKGEPGTRKSTSALSFPTPQYWFSVDKKMKALALPARRWGIDFSKIEYHDYVRWSSGKDPILNKLESFRTNCPYRTLVFDSVTSGGDAINFQTMEMKAGTKTKGGDDKGATIGGIPVGSIEDYKAEASAFMQLIAILKDIQSYINANIILIGHVIGERQAKETAGITSASRVLITGGKTISGKISAYCEETYHFNARAGLNAGTEEYSLFTRHMGDDFARTCLPLPQEIKFNDDPLYGKWIKPAIEKLQSGGK